MDEAWPSHAIAGKTRVVLDYRLYVIGRPAFSWIVPSENYFSTLVM
jgi:hypothetical protein